MKISEAADKTFNVFQVICGQKYRVGKIEAESKAQAEDYVRINPVPMVVEEEAVH